MTLGAESLVVRSDQAVFTEFEAEVVAMNPDKGHCYGFNKIGSRIWQLTAAPILVRDLCSTLENEYRVEPELCVQQVMEFLDGLRLEDLITVIPGPAGRN